MPRPAFKHKVVLQDCNLNQFYAAMTWLEERGLLGEREWAPDMRLRDQKLFYIHFHKASDALVFKLSWNKPKIG